MKKAQFSLEFLLTYGWAFLIVMTMIGALAYVGITNPNVFLSDKCVFETFVCNGITAQGNQIQFALINTHDRALNLTNNQDFNLWDIPGCTVSSFRVANTNLQSETYLWQSGHEAIFTIVCQEQLRQNARLSGVMYIPYQRTDGIYPRTLEGNIQVRVARSLQPQAPVDDDDDDGGAWPWPS
ncbi:MAG: hypothetical protein ACMXYC_03450 [Candidatus Woesearchaeota archaeon]